jgi:glyoxylase-like metal-dependent hydrolase (beta-lactamase superfamily II)
MSWEINCVVVGPIQCNCYIISDNLSNKAYLIDPGAESQDLLKYLQKRRFDLQAILITHAHLDHVGGIEMVHAEFPSHVYYHEGDKPLYENLQMQASLFGFTLKTLESTQPKVGESSLQHDQQFEFSTGFIRVIHTPGHTPGSVCFHLTGERATIFSGDTLFEGSIGRTDLWGGSFEEIIHSIKNRLLTLEDNLLVLPGHGPSTMIGDERRHNPFLLNE